MTIADNIARAELEFREFRIPNRRTNLVFEQIDVLRRVAREAQAEWEAKGNPRAKRPEQKFLPIIAPSHTGKSTAIHHYAETVVAKEEHRPRDRPFLHVTLAQKTSTKRLASDILEEFGDPSFEKGTEAALDARIRAYIAGCKTEVIVLDEIQHVIDSDDSKDPLAGGKAAWSVTEKIKRFLIEGQCPLVLVGTEQAWPILFKNPQLTNRCYPPIHMKPLDPADPDDVRLFLEHVSGFDLKLVERGIFPARSNLVGGNLPPALFEISGGMIGQVSRFLEAATVIALREGASKIDERHLSEAVREWAIPLGYVKHDPFASDGPRARRKAA